MGVENWESSGKETDNIEIENTDYVIGSHNWIFIINLWVFLLSWQRSILRWRLQVKISLSQWVQCSLKWSNQLPGRFVRGESPLRAQRSQKTLKLWFRRLNWKRRFIKQSLSCTPRDQDLWRKSIITNWSLLEVLLEKHRNHRLIQITLWTIWTSLLTSIQFLLEGKVQWSTLNRRELMLRRWRKIDRGERKDWRRWNKSNWRGKWNRKLKEELRWRAKSEGRKKTTLDIFQSSKRRVRRDQRIKKLR